MDYVFKTDPKEAFSERLGDYLWNVFIGDNYTDTFSITLNLSGTKTKTWEIDCDFEQ